MEGFGLGVEELKDSIFLGKSDDDFVDFYFSKFFFMSLDKFLGEKVVVFRYIKEDFVSVKFLDFFFIGGSSVGKEDFEDVFFV